jgi:tRNA (guanine37-N1)-methyltransferase
LFGEKTEASPVTSTAKLDKPIKHLILVCPRYEGVDARVEEYYADKVISIGDYVLMGGDLPAQVFIEALLRHLPGVVGNESSVEQESFTGPFLDYPEYGLPVEWKGMEIPEVVRSGDHQRIAKWRCEQACKKTILKRFDWFVSSSPSKKDLALCLEMIPPHYVVLMHTQVNLKVGHIGTMPSYTKEGTLTGLQFKAVATYILSLGQ